jgi:hypothetical protein
MIAEKALACFHDDGRICLFYRTSEAWKLRSITLGSGGSNPIKDLFVFDFSPDSLMMGLSDVATSSDFTTARFRDLKFHDRSKK